MIVNGDLFTKCLRLEAADLCCNISVVDYSFVDLVLELNLKSFSFYHCESCRRPLCFGHTTLIKITELCSKMPTSTDKLFFDIVCCLPSTPQVSLVTIESRVLLVHNLVIFFCWLFCNSLQGPTNNR